MIEYNEFEFCSQNSAGCSQLELNTVVRYGLLWVTILCCHVNVTAGQFDGTGGDTNNFHSGNSNDCVRRCHSKNQNEQLSHANKTYNKNIQSKTQSKHARAWHVVFRQEP